ncbi:hypothetical protein GKE99_25305, partial [Flavonifractor plautii]|nr:hypothetical protein [Flavonifractor plautii]
MIFCKRAIVVSCNRIETAPVTLFAVPYGMIGDAKEDFFMKLRLFSGLAALALAALLAACAPAAPAEPAPSPGAASPAPTAE